MCVVLPKKAAGEWGGCRWGVFVRSDGQRSGFTPRQTTLEVHIAEEGVEGGFRPRQWFSTFSPPTAFLPPTTNSDDSPTSTNCASESELWEAFHFSHSSSLSHSSTLFVHCSFPLCPVIIVHVHLHLFHFYQFNCAIFIIIGIYSVFQILFSIQRRFSLSLLLISQSFLHFSINISFENLVFSPFLFTSFSFLFLLIDFPSPFPYFWAFLLSFSRLRCALL